jgi:hypothetical protein
MNKKRDHKKALEKRRQKIANGTIKTPSNGFDSTSRAFDKKIFAKIQSIQIAVYVLNSNLADLFKTYSEFQKKLSSFINDNFTGDEPFEIPDLKQNHIDLMYALTCRLSNYLSSYKALLEIIKSVVNDSKINTPEAVKDFITFSNGSDIFKFSHFTKTENGNGLLVILRNSFDHNIILPISVQATTRLFLNDHIEAVRHETPNIPPDELIKTARERQKNFPYAGIQWYDGKRLKPRLQVFSIIDSSLLQKDEKFIQEIIDRDETRDLIQVILKSHRQIEPYLYNLSKAKYE